MRLASLLLVCLFLCGCHPHLDLNKTESLPAGFPKQLLSFSGPTKAFGLDGKPWDSFGLGGPSNFLFINGNYWICASGYTAAGNVTHTMGCWFGPSLTELKPYPGNPILVNSRPGWAAACVEGPDLNTDGVNVYMSYVGFSTNCDDEDHGAIGISSTPISKFPEGLNTMPQVPQITRPKELKWLFRPFIMEIDGICYDYSNAGAWWRPMFHRHNRSAPIIASFKTSGPCAKTEMDPKAWKFNRYELDISQPWEGETEVEEPQVFRTADGMYIMLYGGAWSFKAGYAFTKDPVHGSWTKVDTNPIKQNGIVWLPRVTQDATGQYWMVGNFNSTPEVSLWKANGQ